METGANAGDLNERERDKSDVVVWNIYLYVRMVSGLNSAIVITTKYRDGKIICQ